MVSAVTEFLVVDGRFLEAFLGNLLYSGHLFPLFFGSLYLLQHGIGDFPVDMQIIVQIGLDEIVYIVPDRRAVFPHFGGTEFDFCLGFEIRLMDADADCPYYSLPYVRGVEILFMA